MPLAWLGIGRTYPLQAADHRCETSPEPPRTAHVTWTPTWTPAGHGERVASHQVQDRGR